MRGRADTGVHNQRHIWKIIAHCSKRVGIDQSTPGSYRRAPGHKNLTPGLKQPFRNAEIVRCIGENLEAVGDQFPVWTGSPIRAIDSCAQGVTGITSSMDVNIAPDLYQAFAMAWADGDLGGVVAAYRPMLRLFQRVLAAGGLIIAKAVLVRLGLPVGSTRAPRRPAGDAEYRIAEDIIAEFKLQPI